MTNILVADSEIKNMKKIQSKLILVTGGAGFIGSHLVDDLLKNNHRVVVIDNLVNGTLDNIKNAAKSKKFNFIKGDILKIKDLNKAFKGVDIVFHLACLGVRHSIHNPYENHRVNAEGTLMVLEEAKKRKIQKLFYISSSEIYGATKNFPIDETALPQPLTVYGSSKLAGENYCVAYSKCYGLPTVIVRLFNNFGPRSHFEGDAGELIPRSIIYALSGKKPVIFGNGKNTRDFFYVKDTAIALTNLINLDIKNGEIINMGTGLEMKIVDVVKKIIKIIAERNIKIDFKPNRTADVPRLWVNADKFYHLTRFKSKYSFEEGMRETIDYFKELNKHHDLLSKMPLYNWK